MLQNMEGLSPRELDPMMIDPYSKRFEDIDEWFLEQAVKIADRFFLFGKREKVVAGIDNFFGNGEREENLFDFFVQLARLLAIIEERRGKIAIEDLEAAMSFVGIPGARTADKATLYKYQRVFFIDNPREAADFHKRLWRLQERARQHLAMILNAGPFLGAMH